MTNDFKLVIAIITKGTISCFEVIKGHRESDIKYPKSDYFRKKIKKYTHLKA